MDLLETFHSFNRFRYIVVVISPGTRTRPSSEKEGKELIFYLNFINRTTLTFYYVNFTDLKHPLGNLPP